MTLFDKIKNWIFSKLGYVKLNENPNNPRYTFLGNDAMATLQKTRECKAWYYGDENELLNFYTEKQMVGNLQNPIYNRNKAQFFWGLSSNETDIKRVHSGVPKAIIDTLVNAIGTPTISCDNLYQDRLDKLLKELDFKNIINQKQMPLTLAEGWGAFKPIIDKSVSNIPLLEYYEAEDVEYIIKHGKIVGFIFKDYFSKNKKDYVLCEERYTENGDSYIKYELYELSKNNDVKPVALETLEVSRNLPPEGLVIKGYSEPLAVASKYFEDVYNKGYGLSIIADKLALFDDLDQSLSQSSRTCRLSTPVEYMPNDLLERSKDGKPIKPTRYDRQYVNYTIVPDGDGNGSSQIITTQPQLNFSQYTDEQLSILSMILIGKLSPATMGIDVAKKDNADAQREKEKITIMTRDNVIDRQMIIISKVCEQLLMLDEYMQNGNITLHDHDIKVRYKDFANPTFENKANILSPMLASGTISEEMYVEKLYGDTLTKEEKGTEIERLKEKNKANDGLMLGDFNVNTNGVDSFEQATE